MTASSANPPPICWCLPSAPYFGDGCDQCNPTAADQYQRDAIAEAKAMRPDDEPAEDLG